MKKTESMTIDIIMQISPHGFERVLENAIDLLEPILAF